MLLERVAMMKGEASKGSYDNQNEAMTMVWIFIGALMGERLRDSLGQAMYWFQLALGKGLCSMKERWKNMAWTQLIKLSVGMPCLTPGCPVSVPSSGVDL